MAYISIQKFNEPVTLAKNILILSTKSQEQGYFKEQSLLVLIILSLHY